MHTKIVCAIMYTMTHRELGFIEHISCVGYKKCSSEINILAQAHSMLRLVMADTPSYRYVSYLREAIQLFKFHALSRISCSLHFVLKLNKTMLCTAEGTNSIQQTQQQPTVLKDNDLAQTVHVFSKKPLSCVAPYLLQTFPLHSNPM